ncbi:MAG: hypothetical protein RLZZ500_2607 [Bacteroidota bacterium]|jgi:aldehyde dehydrogenase (NAD+)
MNPLQQSIAHRKQRLKALYEAIEAREEAIIQALSTDFQKPRFEAVVTETAYVLADLKHTLRNIHRWAKPTRVWPSLLNFPSVEAIYKQPYGKVLIIAPWNYPFQLALTPLVAAIAAGNQVVLKPSELTPSVSKIINELIAAVFTADEANVEEGDATVAQALLQQRWDYIFFTGSVGVGKMVAQAAAVHLTPCTLELGGKNPCIVAADTAIELTARRIVWGKFMNAGQTCIAPDYVLVHASKRDALVRALSQEIQKAYGENPKLSPDFARIISERHWHRLTQFLEQGTVLYGGAHAIESRYIAPTLIKPQEPCPLMEEEIFGPLLPIITYTDESELEKWIARYESPLAAYIFTRNIRWAKGLLQKWSLGGGCINDTLIHFNNKALPFGGVGHSGMGAYHGKWGFDTFTHHKSLVYKPFWGDAPIRYAPYKSKENFVKKIMNLF